jgi:hypothetical protein
MIVLLVVVPFAVVVVLCFVVVVVLGCDCFCAFGCFGAAGALPAFDPLACCFGAFVLAALPCFGCAPLCWLAVTGAATYTVTTPLVGMTCPLPPF